MHGRGHYAVLLYVRSHSSSLVCEILEEIGTAYQNSPDRDEMWPPLRMLASIGSKEELSCLPLNDEIDLVEQLREQLREGKVSKLCLLTEKLSQKEIPCGLGFTLDSGIRKWVTCPIGDGHLPDASDRILGRHELETLPDVGILIVEK